MKAILLTLLLSSTLQASNISFSEILQAQETLTISPIEIDGLPVVASDKGASKVCKAAGYEIVRSYEISRSPLGPIADAYRFEEDVLKKVKVGGSFQILNEVVCSR